MLSIRRTLRVGTLVGASCLTLGAAGASASPAVTITVSAKSSGTSLTPDFLGLAVENWTLTKHQFRGSNLGAYMRVLGPHGLLRIGGNSLDESFWTSTGEPAPAWATEGRFGPGTLRELARALRGTGWRVILGVNLRHFDPARAVDEARHAARVLGPQLAAIEPGNEPNDYGISEPAFVRHFRAYVAEVHRALPQMPIVGPDVASGGFAWLGQFARQEASRRQLSIETLHEYPESACNGAMPTIADLLSLRDMRAEQVAARQVVAAGRVDHVPAIIDETNSAVCWGAPGTSNTFASALWTLDYSLLLAQQGLSDVNFQGRIAGCAEYSPLCTLGSTPQLAARPEFYGLLAVRQVTPGRFLRLSDPDIATLRAYAVKARNGSLSLVLDNLASARRVHIELPPGAHRRARKTTLRTSSAEGLASTAVGSITLGGRRIGANAVFRRPRYTGVRVRGNTLTLSVPAASATIVKVS